MPFISVATPPTEFNDPRGACVMNSEARRSCHGWIVDLSFRTSRPEGERQGSIHGARKSQNRMVSPPRMISPDGERIRYLPSPVGACACATDAPSRWSRIKNVKAEGLRLRSFRASRSVELRRIDSVVEPHHTAGNEPLQAKSRQGVR